jgi:hypothetical protein
MTTPPVKNIGSSACRRRLAIAIAAILPFCLPTNAQAQQSVEFDLTVHAGKHERNNAPVCVLVNLPATLTYPAVQVFDAQRHGIAAQITDSSLAESKSRKVSSSAEAKMVARELHFILAHLDAGADAHLHATIGGVPPTPKHDSFRWHGHPQDDHFLLTFGNRKVLEYVAPRFDDSTPKRREETYKPFHHLYDATGTRLVTKGVGGNDTHHRGLFYGFNRISYDQGRKHADTWQCLGDAYQSHVAFEDRSAGPVLGRDCVAIDWHGEGKQVFAHEQRELTAYAVPGGTLVDFVSLLRPADGPVHLEGDPHHSGFHFRAADEVSSKSKKETYYLRPDGVGQPDQTINWDSTPKDPRTSDQPWKGMCFVLGAQRYTAAILDRPDNPKPAHWSERDYGRFGSTFVADVTAEHPLFVRYRVWLQDGETTPARLAALDADFDEPVAVDVRPR